MSDYDFTNDSMLELYLFESTTLLAQLDEILLQSEHDGTLSPDNINEIFRIMHTIKGSSAMMSFHTISEVSHKLEDLFFLVRDKGVSEDYFDVLFDLVLKVSDFLKTEVDKIQAGEPVTAENEELIEEVRALLASMSEEKPAKMAVEGDVAAKTAAASEQSEPASTLSKAPDSDTVPPPAGSEMSPHLSEDAPVYHLHIYFTEDCQMENIRAFMLVSKLQRAGRVLRMIPEDLESNADVSEYIMHNGFYLTIATELSQEDLEEMAKGTLSVDTVGFVNSLPDVAADFVETPSAPSEEFDAPPPENSVGPAASAMPDPVAEEAPVAAEQPKPAAAKSPGQNSPGSAKPARQNLISVDLNKLDTLMNLVGELVITESMVSGNPDLAGLELENFHKSARQLRKLTDEIQDIVMSVRMVPISGTFQKMRRIVRDMGKQLSKDVELTPIGETTEVDKTIVDAIGDPLMHLVRNAMDHAIEPAEERIRVGKSETGSIILSAQNIGGDILISVSDDGRGLDAEAILNKAKNKGLLVKPESEYTEKEAFNLIMMPGFSTKEAVTEFSGRGVGMDVVRKNIEKIGGTVTIESTKGKGTDICFKIPLTLAIIASMEIQAGENVYAIPIVNIRESFKATTDQLLSDPDGNEMIMIRGSAYPVIRLHEIFHIENCITKIEDGILLLVDSGERLACILADSLLGKHQVVVKPLPNYLSWYNTQSSGIAGCTILGDGSISLILDIPGILKQH